MTTYFIRTENPESGKKIRDLLRDEDVNTESDLSHGTVTNVMIVTKNNELLEKIKSITDVSLVEDFDVELIDDEF